MATDSAMGFDPGRCSWLRLPERIPDLNRRWLILFQVLWVPALLLAIVGPIAGIWFRFDQAADNSVLITGSRVGLALSEDDLTTVRFPVGQAAKAAGVKPGDDIVAINGLPIAKVVPISKRGLERPHDATETDYAMFTPIIEGGDDSDYTLRVRSKDGSERDFTVKASEDHVAQAARSAGLPPVLLSVVDLLHVLTYPFLIFAAWILHRRKREDLISSVLSLAVLLTIISEQPSAAFLTFVAHVPEWLHQRIYDLGNICLLAGILLFPFGELRPRATLAILALLPVLFFLSGDLYRAAFVLFMMAGVLTLLWRLQNTPPSPARQQIKWALLGFSGYGLFLGIAFASDGAKLGVHSFGAQLSLELIAGLSFGLAFLLLQLGLLVALLRFRLYDAEAVISRSANFALITLGVAAVFAATADGLKQLILNYYGNTGSTAPVVFAAAIATVVISPLQERIQRWSEKRFQRNLVKLRDDLPDCVRELRESASMDELLDDTLRRIEEGTRTTRTTVIVEGKILAIRGTSPESVENWLTGFDPEGCKDELCSVSDKLFPIRVPLQTATDDHPIGWLLIGPRPDGSLLSKDEQKALVEVASPITRAIRVVTRRDERERVIIGRIEALECRLPAATSSAGRERNAD
ncbi:hypothetical protein LZ016_02590 [Sphingomonas sp. SM33]|uniref:PDZ domain-containing protein n=1 Tax=Sphingomonas telluris TaxID=2907998 RepID=A0ABS9VKA8_9SPHN|nr:hypothetical protein [Sphingomonas telluris]MCH8614994.1 hypothetical protein [Sphingomonas telluris]